MTANASTHVRINEIQQVTFNGRKCIAFTAWERSSSGMSDAWVHVGRFFAPRGTAKRDLPNFMTEEN
tara:strand:- start:563 stop:763 length:201 start_codon:yes stop_codon:yes gene_type:complete